MVRPYLRSETIEPDYADRCSVTALDVCALKLSAWLKTESTKSRKQKRSLKQMQTYAYWDLKALMIALPHSLGNGKRSLGNGKRIN